MATLVLVCKTALVDRQDEGYDRREKAKVRCSFLF